MTLDSTKRRRAFQLLEEYLDSNSCDGKVLPQSTQFYDCESLGLNSIHQNYLYFFEGDIVKIIKKYFSPEDQLNFFKIEVDRIFEAAKEVFIDSEEIKEDKDVYGFGISSYSHNQPVSNYDFSFNENTLDFSSNYSPVINKSKHEQTEIGVLTPIKKSNFKSTVSSFFGFILSLNQEGFQKESDIYNYFFNKYKEINWCKTIQLFMNTESENNFQVKERVSELFIAALVELVREDINIRRYRNKGNIYSDYEKFRKDKAWKESRITPFISSATKELSEYLK